MLVLALVFLTSFFVEGRPFEVTHIVVPEVVPPGQQEVEIECRYNANFTLLNWFKGHKEFFRYKPHAKPNTRSFPVLGVGKIEVVACGPTACRLKLIGLTEDATGLYGCDIERDRPPYTFATRRAYMEVHGRENRKPRLEGLATEYGEGDEIKAHCRGAPDAELRWYINGKEQQHLRGSAVLEKRSTKLLFEGIPPMITIQCSEYNVEKEFSSIPGKARWEDKGAHETLDEMVDGRPQEECNKSEILKLHPIFVCVYSLYLLKL